MRFESVWSNLSAFLFSAWLGRIYLLWLVRGGWGDMRMRRIDPKSSSSRYSCTVSPKVVPPAKDAVLTVLGNSVDQLLSITVVRNHISQHLSIWKSFHLTSYFPFSPHLCLNSTIISSPSYLSRLTMFLLPIKLNPTSNSKHKRWKRKIHNNYHHPIIPTIPTLMMSILKPLDQIRYAGKTKETSREVLQHNFSIIASISHPICPSPLLLHLQPRCYFHTHHLPSNLNQTQA